MKLTKQRLKTLIKENLSDYYAFNYQNRNRDASDHGNIEYKHIEATMDKVFAIIYQHYKSQPHQTVEEALVNLENAMIAALSAE